MDRKKLYKGETMATRGQPKRFNGEQLIELFDSFCSEIEASGFDRVPSQTEFCRWLTVHYAKTDRRTIYNTLNKYFPDLKKDFERLQSDTITKGGMLGRYNVTMCIFALKNWCGWGDNGKTAVYKSYGGEKQEDALSKALREEAERMEHEKQNI